jgi:hypothetical protein
MSQPRVRAGSARTLQAFPSTQRSWILQIRFAQTHVPLLRNHRVLADVCFCLFLSLPLVASCQVRPVARGGWRPPTSDQSSFAILRLNDSTGDLASFARSTRSLDNPPCRQSSEACKQDMQCHFLLLQAGKAR